MLFLSNSLSAAPKAELLSHWAASDENSVQIVDHQLWQSLLDDYVSTDASGVNRFNYAAVDGESKLTLKKYIDQLASVKPQTLARQEQMPYWINLYNALTVQVILDHYPVKSIKKIGKGFFSFGPWDDSVIKIQGKSLTLNNIEHGILRPIWADDRIHFAVNCASIGCPNLALKAYTAKNTEQQLQQAGIAYINHSRGVRFNKKGLRLSSIFDWYGDDFGKTQQQLLKRLAEFAEPELAEKLMNYQGKIKYDYDWGLNQP